MEICFSPVTPEEQGPLRKKEKARDRLRRNDPRRKTNGKRPQYNDTVKAVGQGNIVNLLTCLFPAGGTGMTNSFYDQMNQTTFVQIDPLSVWVPYLMTGSVIIEIPLFFILAVRAYCRHQAA